MPCRELYATLSAYLLTESQEVRRSTGRHRVDACASSLWVVPGTNEYRKNATDISFMVWNRLLYVSCCINVLATLLTRWLEKICGPDDARSQSLDMDSFILQWLTTRVKIGIYFTRIAVLMGKWKLTD